VRSAPKSRRAVVSASRAGEEVKCDAPGGNLAARWKKNLQHRIPTAAGTRKKITD